MREGHPPKKPITQGSYLASTEFLKDDPWRKRDFDDDTIKKYFNEFKAKVMSINKH